MRTYLNQPPPIITHGPHLYTTNPMALLVLKTLYLLNLMHYPLPFLNLQHKRR